MEANPATSGGPEMSGKAMNKANKLAEQQALYKAMQDRASGAPLTSDQSAMVAQDKAMRDERKNELISAGIGAAGGIASGALQALLAKDSTPKSRAAIPGGGAGNIPKAASPDFSTQRASISAEQRPSLALEMLRRGGYK